MDHLARLRGEFPGPDIIERLFVLHIRILPVVIALVIAVHLAIAVRQKHSQFAGPGRREDNVVGVRVWPTYAVQGHRPVLPHVRAAGGPGGLVQINPIWIYGPFDPAEVSAAAQPDWYMGWLEGALWLMPPWEPRLLGYELPNPFFPGGCAAGDRFPAPLPVAVHRGPGHG